MKDRITASVIGGSGYVGGELIRLLLGHPRVQLEQVSSETFRGQPITTLHPNLRGCTNLAYCSKDDLRPCHVLFLCLPHGHSMGSLSRWEGLAEVLVDLSADFRLKDPRAYPVWYGVEHPDPERLAQFVYGIPELHRAQIREARFISGAGCLATSAVLSLWPLFREDVARRDSVIVEAKVGSSAAGGKPSLATHHPERSGAVRSFSPTGHRHTGEIEQELACGSTPPRIHFTATAIEAVRGVLTTSHVFLKKDLSEKDLWKIYREACRGEFFVRLAKSKAGIYRYPEPKILAGSNFCDVGFELDPRSGRLVVLGALDNLMKGAAGNGVQALNARMGWDERTGLEFPGLHPI
ncbi:MAG: N-acetyl-gamma-glutamyl-phosphate reductase [Acidobacteria bacterium]|nr:N-acetyl-gamma-glutamyl-phosphate reductase [Acidobacteriota bacterium]